MRPELSPYELFVARQWSHRRNGAAASTPAQDANPLRQLYIMATGLAGETGEVMEHLKKHVRDGKLDVDALALELGDVLYYLTRIGQEFGLSLADIQERNQLKLIARRHRGSQ
jgi:NTP pyrophosphatase (non-canonical NTP hydrolase)